MPRRDRPRSRPVRAAALLALLLAAAPAAAQRVTFPASDGGTVHATLYEEDRPARALIVAFHQGGASGEAEYAPVLPRLLAEGYDVLAVDQRAGGSLFGGTNRTIAARGGEETDYCAAYPDLEGALEYAGERRGERPIVLWGSSYSAALAMRLAATGPEDVIAVLAFSPASGEPMAGCLAEDVSDGIRIPALALRPRSEAERPGVSGQLERFGEQGHRTFVADPGEHGSSMLVEERVGAPVEATWAVVLEFLEEATRQGTGRDRR